MAFGKLNLGRMGIIGGLRIPPWVLTTFGTPVIDANYAGTQFYFNRQTYASEALLNTAAGGVKASEARTFGPYIPNAANNVMVNGDFSGGTTGWTPISPATISVSAGQLVVTGNSGTNPTAYNATTTVAGQAYQFTGSRQTLGVAVATIAANNVGFNPLQTFVGGDTPSVLTPGSAVVSSSAVTMYFGARITGTAVVGTANFDDFSVVPCFPFAGMSLPGQGAAQITATTPSSAAGTQVVFECGDHSGLNRIRLAWGADTHLHYIISYGTADQFDLDIGVIPVSTQFTVLIGAGVDTFFYSLNGGVRVFGPQTGSVPGLGILWAGRSKGGETWLGTIQRLTFWPTALPAAPYLVGYGDSLMFGTGATVFPTDTWLYKLGGFFGRRNTNRGVGGETSTAIRTRFVSTDPALNVQNAGGYTDPNTIWLIDGGYNNYTNVAGTVENDIAIMVAALPVGAKYLIMGMPTAEVAALYTGGVDRAKFNTINTNLSNTYGTRFVNIDAALKAQSTHTGQDLIDDGHDIVPVSQRADAVHWNNAGHLTVYAAMKAKVQALGWG